MTQTMILIFMTWTMIIIFLTLVMKKMHMTILPRVVFFIQRAVRVMTYTDGKVRGKGRGKDRA